MKIQSLSEQNTFDIAKDLGQKASSGDIYLLEGDLGVGKTVFAKGFARGLGILEPITSPTFTIIQEYGEGRLPFYHFDVYRIADEEEMYELDYEAYFYGEGICLIEWPSRIRDLLPSDCHVISIRKDLAIGFDFRWIEIDEKRGNDI